jgi:hypothetical protein
MPTKNWAERKERFMKNYVFVYYDGNEQGSEPMEDTTKAWMDWFGGLGDKVVDAGNPFNNNGMAVEKSGVSKIENYPATGYSIIKAHNMEDAVKLTKGCPLLDADKTAVRVYEALPM